MGVLVRKVKMIRVDDDHHKGEKGKEGVMVEMIDIHACIYPWGFLFEARTVHKYAQSLPRGVFST